MNIKRIICASLAILLMTFTCFSSSLQNATAVEVENPIEESRAFDIVTLNVYLDQSFRTEFANYNDKAYMYINNAHQPFMLVWNIAFSETYNNLQTSNFKVSQCPLPYGSQCTTASCGSRCDNSNSNFANHHKNFYQYYYQLHNSSLKGNKNIMVCLSSINACRIVNGIHKNDIGGLGGNDLALTVATNSLGTWTNVQLIQHEISHVFGCGDGVCSTEKPCIMSGGYDGKDTGNIQDIWCANCKTMFDKNKY